VLLRQVTAAPLSAAKQTWPQNGPSAVHVQRELVLKGSPEQISLCKSLIEAVVTNGNKGYRVIGDVGAEAAEAKRQIAAAVEDIATGNARKVTVSHSLLLPVVQRWGALAVAGRRRHPDMCARSGARGCAAVDTIAHLDRQPCWRHLPQLNALRPPP